ncbi:MAG: glycosyltransferase [Moheibacter sp.]
MRILQVINSLGMGGAEKLVSESIPLIRKAGVDTDVLLLWDNEFPFYSELKSTDCCKIYILKKSDKTKDIYSLGHIPKIRRIIKNYDLIHVHLFPASYYTALANIGLNKKIIFTEHSTSNKRISNPRYKLIEKWVYAQYDCLVCITDEVKNIYQNYLGLQEKSVVIQNGVNLDRIHKAEAYKKIEISSKIKNDDFLLFQASGFKPPKDQDTIIRSLNFLPENVKLVLAGSGSREGELKELTAKLNLENRVIFLGPRTDIPEILKTVDVVVLSSNYEGLSLASIEGMASGKPFVASDVPGLGEVVDGAGLLFSKGNEKEFSEIILELMNHPENQKEVAERCMKRAEEYDIHKMVTEYIELYRRLTL